MDPRDSPYTPGAGTDPITLAGRAREIEQVAVLLDRLARGRSAEAVLFAGSRGMGKTVLLRECRRRAEASAWFTTFEEVDPQLALRDVMALNAHDVLLKMRASKRYGERIKRALGVLKAFTSIGVLGVTLNIDADRITGTADTGFFKRDLLALLRELGQVAQTDGSGVVFFLDELHTFRGTEEMAVLDAVIHGLAQEGLPVTVVGAGIFPGPGYRDDDDPRSPSTYAGRLYRVIRLRPLHPEAARAALTEPALDAGVEFDDAALDNAVDFAGGSPWFLQLLGEEVWDRAAGSPITAVEMRDAIDAVRKRLFEDFYPRVLRGIHPEQALILGAMARRGGTLVPRAELAKGSSLSSDVFLPVLRTLITADLLELASTRGALYSLTIPGLSNYINEVEQTWADVDEISLEA
jgi:AAA ATPase domain